MNIFRIDINPWDSAKLLFKYDPVRARKQLLESCQILASVQHLNNGKTDLLKADGAPYKAAHPNHPCTTWSANSIQQYDMLFQTTEALAELIQDHACSRSFYAARRELEYQRIACNTINPSTNQPYEGLIVVRRGHTHKVVYTVADYACLIRQYLVDTKNFPKDATL